MSSARAKPTSPSAGEIAAVADRIEPEDLRFVFTRSSGPGGQNVNKVNTRATLFFDFDRGHTFSEVERRCIRAALATRIGRDGAIRVVASRYRTQSANRDAAFDRLCTLIAVAIRPRKRRKATRVPAVAKRRRLQQKQRRGETKRGRAKPSGNRDDW